MVNKKSTLEFLKSKTKAIKIAAIVTSFAAPLAMLTAPAAATGTFTDHLWRFASGATTNTIDFKKGGSKIYDSGNLHIATDDKLYLDAPSSVEVKKDLIVKHNLNVGSGGISQMYVGNTNHNCDEACVDLTPSDEGTTNAVWELQNDGGTGPESAGIALNSDSINMWNPGDGGLLNLFDEDNFCTGCDIGQVGSGADVEAALTVTDEGGILANGNSHFYGDVQVDGNLTATGIIDFSEITGVTGGFEVGTNLEVDGLSFFDDSVNLDQGVNQYFNYSCDTTCWWGAGVGGSGEFTLWNSNFENTPLAISEGGDVTITGESRHATLTLGNDGDLQVDGHTTLGSSHWDDLTVNATATFENGVTFNDETIFSGRIYGDGHVDGDVTGDPVTIGRYALGDTTYHPGLTVWGDSTFKGALTIGGDDTDTNYNALQVLNPDGTRVFNVNTEGANRVSVGHWDTSTELKVWGDTDLVSDLDVRGDSYVEYLNVDNGLDVYGTANFYDGVNFNSDLLPGSDDSYDLGAAYARFRNAYFSGTIYAGNISYANFSTSGNITDGGNLVVTGNITTGGNENITGNATVTGNITANGAITATAGVNFSAATSLRVPIGVNDLTDGADASNTCSGGNTGDLQLDTGSSLFVCDGTNWQQLDN